MLNISSPFEYKIGSNNSLVEKFIQMAEAIKIIHQKKLIIWNLSLQSFRIVQKGKRNEISTSNLLQDHDVVLYDLRQIIHERDLEKED